VLVEQGTSGRELIVLLDGIAHVTRKDPQGREVILRVLKTGEVAGDMCLIDNQPHSATIRCIKSCHVLITPGQALAASLARQPYPLTDALLRHLTSRLRTAHRQVATLALFDVPDRVHRQLFELGTELANGTREVCDRLSQQDIARMVGASREMVGRALAQLELKGTVTREDGRFIVANSLPE
jgi:CRP/FNR family transcriptional regulator, cyclic AMP receptor protein